MLNKFFLIFLCLPVEFTAAPRTVCAKVMKFGTVSGKSPSTVLPPSLDCSPKDWSQMCDVQKWDAFKFLGQSRVQSTLLKKKKEI